MLVLVLASYYVSAAIGLDLGPSAGVLALAVFCSSHVGEIVRGALQAIPRGQTEAAKAIGLSFTQTFVGAVRRRCANACRPGSTRRPRWSRRPPLSVIGAGAAPMPAGLGQHGGRDGQGVHLSVIGVAELLLRTQEIISRNFAPPVLFPLAGGLAFIVNFGIERLGKYVERKTALPS